MMATIGYEQHPAGYGALWFGLGGAPFAWSLQAIANYAIVAHSCYPLDMPRTTPSIGDTWAIALGISIAALILALVALRVSVREWRQTRMPERGEGPNVAARSDRAGTRSYMALSGIFLSVIFTSIIIFNGVALFVVPTCSY